jgi:hypothetical protein
MVSRRLAVLFATAIAAAQGPLVLPGSHAASEGTTSTNVPFGRSTAVRVQAVYDPMLFPAGPRTITAIAFRLDGDATAEGKQVECEIRMSTAALPLVATSASFGGNRGVDEVVVLPRQVLSLPGHAAAATPSPFLPAIALAVPFVHDRLAGALLVEVVVFAQTPGTYSLDATFVCTSPEVAVGPPACQPAQGLPLRLQSATTQVMWGRPWLVRALDAAPGGLVLLALGQSETGTWNGAPLPVDLGPAGAPLCFVSIDVVDTFFQVAQGDGTATFAFAVPNEPGLVGQWVRFQAATVGPGLNVLGVATSQARKVQVCGFEPVARLWSGDLASPVGTLEMGTAPVVLVTTQ